jgi:hypothetical protein
MTNSIKRFRPATAGLIALFAAGCFGAAKSGNLTTGMTPDQTVQAMGQADLKDNVNDPKSGSSVLRFVWLDKGQAAVFSPDNHVASITAVETNTKQQIEEQAAAQTPHTFDPISTPLGFMFFPVKAGLTYIGAGVNCVGGGGCHQPSLPSPWNG